MQVSHFAGMLALDGRCKTLDAAANGYVRAEDCIAFLLESSTPSCTGPLRCTVNDYECYNAVAVVVRGSSVNQDGRSSSLTAPNGPAQQVAIKSALASGSLKACDVSTIEMHGTGTALGDPIEVGAVSAVMQVSFSSSMAYSCPSWPACVP